MTKISIFMVGVALLLMGAGCQASRSDRSQNHPAAFAGASDNGALGGVAYGHGESGIPDYRQILASPGPFE